MKVESAEGSMATGSCSHQSQPTYVQLRLGMGGVMNELEDQAAASARSAQTEKQHSLQLEKDLKTLAAELEQVKKESEAAKRTVQKAHNDLKTVFDTCRKGIGAMCQHIFGMLMLLLTPSFTLI